MKCMHCGSENLEKKKVFVEGAREDLIGYSEKKGVYDCFIPIDGTICKDCGFVMLFDRILRK